MLWKALPLALGLAGSTLALSTLSAPQDYESLPPSAAEMHTSAGELQPLELAVAVAAKDTAGKAFGARLQGGAWVVDTASPTARYEVVVGADGTVQSKREVPRFPGEPAVGELKEMEGGLKYFVLRAGTGEKPADATKTVKVHYTGYLTDGTKFDSSVDRGQPASFPLNRVIRGWTVGVGDMQVGEKRKLVIPYDMAYGAAGRGPTIPPKATLIFDVELIEIL